MKRKPVEGFLIGAAAAAVALLIWGTGVLERWEHVTWAWRVELFAKPGRFTDKVKLILLDQASLDWGSRTNDLSWPWPREVYAPILEYCRRHGARAVVFDVLCTEPSVYGVSDDQALGSAIESAPAFVGALCLHRETGFGSAWPDDCPERVRFRIDNVQEWAARISGWMKASSANFPVEEIRRNAGLLANVMDDPDPDGIFRRASLFRIFDNRIVPSPGFAAFAAGCLPAFPGGDEQVVCHGAINNGRLAFCGRNIPLDAEGKMILRFRGPAGTFRSFSAAAVIESELLAEAGGKETIPDADSLRDSYVFFGFSAPGLLDLRPTPISSISPGVEIHATVLDNLLSGDFLRGSPPLAVGTAAFIMSLLAGLSLVLFGKRAWHTVIAFSLFAPLPVAVGFAAYPLGFQWPIVVLELAVLLALTGATVLNYATEGRLKAFYREAFRHYLSPAVIERLLEDPSRLRLGGERRVLTIFFSDLEGFSGFSERLDPEMLTALLNDYLSDMTDIILEEGGTLDKYEGDAIMAFWNAPVDQADHAERACRAAIRCGQRLEQRREEFRRRTGAVLRMRIGINTGEAVVGNMGSKTRFDYTVLGDAANLASRLEGANKRFGTCLMVSEQTWNQRGGKIDGRQIGLIRVVGRAEPVRVFEPAPGTLDAAGCELFEKGLSCSLGGKWREALECFEKLPEDPVARVYAERCHGLLATPGDTWDGVWNLMSK